MRYLLDTHALIWATTHSSFLPAPISAILADSGNVLFVSAATSWEIATKHRLGKLPPAGQLLVGFEEQVERAGYTIRSITSEHARTAGAFRAKHGDPFDRILAAQDFLEDLVLRSNERQLDQFGAYRAG